MQKYRELSFVKNAIEYAESGGCDKVAKKHIMMLVGHAENYMDRMHFYKEVISSAKEVLNKKYIEPE